MHGTHLRNAPPQPARQVANYPFDGFPDRGTSVRAGERNPAPDDATLQHLAKGYAASHAFMSESPVSECGSVNPWVLGWSGEGRLVQP